MTINTPLPTEFAPADRLPREQLLRQHEAWASQSQTGLISNATPNLLLILNHCRQIVFANDRIRKLGKFETFEDYLGIRTGELVGCVHATETLGGCGTTRFCSTCGAVKAILAGLHGEADVEECLIKREENEEDLHLRVWTTPVSLDGEAYTIFSIQDIAIELENKRLLEENLRLAVEDPLTGILNRRAFMERATKEFQRSLRYEHEFSMIMIDFDGFKQVNDRYGHPLGDCLLIEMTGRITRQLREIDLFGRYGGDEFIIVLVETPFEGALEVAERLRSAIQSAPFLTEKGELIITISTGISSLDPAVDTTIQKMIERCDQSMYEYKTRSRKNHT